METQDRFSVCTFGEARTESGQLVEFTCPSGAADQVSEFLRANVRTLELPATHRVNVAHGGYGKYSRYDIVQHKYAGGGPDEGGSWGYIEVLEIKNPPEGRCGIVIHECRSAVGAQFAEWETLTDARAAFEKCWSNNSPFQKFRKLPGFKRAVACGALTPWFYTIGDEQLIGDYAFPGGLQDDPVYRFGRQFVVHDSDGFLTVKTCMGTRFAKRSSRDYPYKVSEVRLVYWSDGSVWDENCGGLPRPLEAGEAWITEAIQQFRALLAGKSTKFTINFADGNKFVGKLVEKTPCPEGRYFVVVHLKDEREPRRGWVEFQPTPEAPDIIKYVTQRFMENDKVVEQIKVERAKAKRSGRQWLGVFFQSSK